MPANRPQIDREQKRAEILDAADELLVTHGYETTTMASIARQAGVAANSVYWYFPSKDDVLAAVLDRRLGLAVDALGRNGAPLLEQAVDALAKLDEVATLTATVHERAKVSAAVAEVHQAFHAFAEREVAGAFEASGLGPADAQLAAAAIVAIVEGIHLHSQRRDTAARDALVVWVAQRLVAGPAA